MNILLLIFSIVAILHARVMILEKMTKMKESGKKETINIASESLLIFLGGFELIRLAIIMVESFN